MKLRKFVLEFILLLSVAALEVFNYNAVDFAIKDITPWSTFFAFGVCGIGLAGILKISTEKMDRIETALVLGAWLSATAMNALLLWWALSQTISQSTLFPMSESMKYAPAISASVILLIRTLMLGSVVPNLFMWMKKSTLDRLEHLEYNRPVPETEGGID